MQQGESWGGPLAFTTLLLARKPQDQLHPPRVDLIQEGVVSSEEADALTFIWEHRYAPWIPNEDSSNPIEPTTFLQVAQWTIAGRHVTSEPGLMKRLSTVLDRCFVRAAMGLDNTHQAVQALLILAMWSGAVPAHEPASDADPSLQTQAVGTPIDAELVISLAINLASKLHLELDVEAVMNQKEADSKGETPPAPSKEQMDRCRLLFRVSAFVVYTSVAKGRVCSTRVPLHYAEKVFGSGSLLAAQYGTSADARLVFQCNMLDVALRMAELTASAESVEALGPNMWNTKLHEDFKTLEHIQQSIQTSIALTEPDEVMPYTVLHLQSQMIKLLMMARAFKSVFKVIPKMRPGMATAIASAVTGNPSATHPLEPSRPSLAAQPEPDSQYVLFSSRTNSRDVHLGSRIENSALEWARSTKEANESLMVIWLGLRRSYPPRSYHGVVKIDEVFPPMAYSPDYMLGSALFGPSFGIKIHLMAMTLFRVQTLRAELARSLLGRVLRMLQEASPSFHADSRITSPNDLVSTASASPSDTRSPPSIRSGASGGLFTAPPGTVEQDAEVIPTLPSPTLVGRAAEVLAAMIDLWDRRTADFKANKLVVPKFSDPPHNWPAEDGPPGTSPSNPDLTPDSSKQGSGTSPSEPGESEKPDWSSEKGLHTLASTLENFKNMGAVQTPKPPSGSEPSIPPSLNSLAQGRPLTPNRMQQFAGFPTKTGLTPAPVPGYEGFAQMGSENPLPPMDLSSLDLFGSMGFDLYQYWDPTVLYTLPFDNSGPPT
ncbi:hypothetical protein DL93DRAFT_2076884 [Clavulina sp. PMI_390]|nr:hypothetical protein DL93DRAFT_2076884 [Clavulina sp. PMI_390]